MATDLVKVLSEATAADLADVTARREEIEKELEGIKAVERILDLRINGKQKRKSPCPRAKSTDLERAPGVLAEKIYDCIVANGPGTAGDIALKLEVRPQAVGVVAAKSPWFEQLANGKWAIAVTGGRHQ